jgi:hypothetical protein
MPSLLRAAAIALALLSPAGAGATLFKVTLDGAFTADQLTGEAIDPIAFRGWFFIDGRPDQVVSDKGLTVYGYGDGSVRWLHATALGVRYTAAGYSWRTAPVPRCSSQSRWHKARPRSSGWRSTTQTHGTAYSRRSA